MVYMGSPEREEATFLLLLRDLRTYVSPRSESAPGAGACIPSAGCVVDRDLN